jgi:hypothetical protein
LAERLDFLLGLTRDDGANLPRGWHVQHRAGRLARPVQLTAACPRERQIGLARTSHTYERSARSSSPGTHTMASAA